jgi:hypothetical protein
MGMGSLDEYVTPPPFLQPTTTFLLPSPSSPFLIYLAPVVVTAATATAAAASQIYLGLRGAAVAVDAGVLRAQVGGLDRGRQHARLPCKSGGGPGRGKEPRRPFPQQVAVLV